MAVKSNIEDYLPAGIKRARLLAERGVKPEERTAAERAADLERYSYKPGELEARRKKILKAS